MVNPICSTAVATQKLIELVYEVPGLELLAMASFAAIAVSRQVQEATGVSIKKLVTLLAQVRDGVVTIDGVEHHGPAALTPEIEELVTKLE